ncbi:MAG: phosphoribosyltransferase family protein [Acidobacteriota bacterium]|jgi:predicted phosphoribosyltransferase
MDRFIDRRDAGARLAEALAPRVAAWPSPVVLGIPRGGVVVADVVARTLELELDVLGVEKVGAPWNAELAVGAVGEGDALWIDPDLSPLVGAGVLRDTIERERSELADKLADVRAVRPRISLTGRTALVVDDGIATGATVRAALLALESERPALRVLAVPVGPPDTLAALAAVADEVVCPLQPASFRAVGLWYEVFDQTPQREVLRIFEERGTAAERP